MPRRGETYLARGISAPISYIQSCRVMQLMCNTHKSEVSMLRRFWIEEQIQNPLTSSIIPFFGEEMLTIYETKHVGVNESPWKSHVGDSLGVLQDVGIIHGSKFNDFVALMFECSDRLITNQTQNQDLDAFSWDSCRFPFHLDSCFVMFRMLDCCHRCTCKNRSAPGNLNIPKKVGFKLIRLDVIESETEIHHLIYVLLSAAILARTADPASNDDARALLGNCRRGWQRRYLGASRQRTQVRGKVREAVARSIG